MGDFDAVPLQRIGTPDDTTDAVLARAGFIRRVHGQVIIQASGGLV
jgi:hypothetical protein